MKIFTIGFTKSSAQSFFERIDKSGTRRIVDTRINTDSQLSAFAKQVDLKYFLGKLTHSGYEHASILAPTGDLLSSYRKKEISWRQYEASYLALLAARRVEERLSMQTLDGACLLCSEATPEHCHRRLAAEYLSRAWGGVQIVHL